MRWEMRFDGGVDETVGGGMGPCEFQRIEF